MTRGHASRWDGDDVDPWGEPIVPLRAKAIVRRTPASWEERDQVWHATIGGWVVRAAKGPSGAWEWSAFAQGGHSRALRCTGFVQAESAKRDAEGSLAQLE